MQQSKKQIIIFSEYEDNTTTYLMSWLISMAETVIRLNSDDPNLRILLINNEKVKIVTFYGKYELHKDDVFWFRRAGSYSIFRTREKNEEKLQIKSFNFMEAQNVWQSLLYWALENGNCLDHPFNADVNKTNVLQLASKTGLPVPDWILAGTREDVAKFLNKKEKKAVKPFTSLVYVKGKRSIKLLTGCIDKKSIENIPDIFMPMIFQEYIDKKYELRCFLLKDKLYSMAIFSQKDSTTKIDFRNYNDEKPNRYIPYHLPKEYSKKLIRLARILGLDTGSFDILVDKNDKFYFLEVNPVGQFGMVSYPCNYNIEKHIAEYLVKQLRNEKKRSF